ncbi:DNA polymerase III alpha subunit [Metamycoplasma cloacale]|uniref:DNA-directed DNA polymerase n=1 Tax=Metamycoplasma cloacale TaxID=92401 RepID=A0A2Z4LL76_9BACT|nr:DNA polymerase III subunit alpha [Metamycoplasma cloacale]AWX42482.1 DNA polymerase III subunit alpha [Metamycoplasma cloacale]VEU79172.1 DNA polymerase III alpha subunit [Metamycoplasma cloacale]
MKLINGHLNTIFSFLESTITIDNLFQQLKEKNIEYFSITEHNNLFSFAPILSKSRKENLKPIFGLDCDIDIDGQLFRYILYPKNLDGWNAIKLISYKLLSKENVKLIDILKDNNIYIVEHPILGYWRQTNCIIEQNNYYYGIDINEVENNSLTKTHTHKCLIINHFSILNADENSTIDVLSKMKDSSKIANFYIPLFFEIEDDVEYKDLIIQTNEFLKQCYIHFETEKFELPKYPNDLNISSYEYLERLIKQNLPKLFKKENWNSIYSERLKYELSVIKQLKFEDYFLIIQDWINYAKNNDISVGPGRGSAAGSLVSYILGITEIDPIKYNLIFERFLNPERVTMPDIDVDVQDDKRHLVLQYLIDKYGVNNVANIVTYSTLGKKSSIRDVMSAFGKNISEINSVSKAISDAEINLLQEYETNKKFALELNKLNEVDFSMSKQILYEANKLEGLYRQSGTHAAGIVLSSKPIIDKIPTYLLDGIQQTQTSMEYLEEFGLLKMDILGLRTLTTIKEILSFIKSSKNIEIDLSKIDYNDQLTFKLLTSGNTAGIFQLESYGMMNALKKVGVSSFDDITAIISLYRPGPMEHINTYVKRKFGKEAIPKINATYDEIVKNTYGIIIYQEQIMQIVQAVAGFSFGHADLIRRIISKKQVDLMLKEKEIFIKAAIQNGYSLKDAQNIFDNIEKFADYGFNKSHAVSYATLSYQMAYLKAHFPLEFYASAISSAQGSHATIAKFANEARNLDIEIISPNINYSSNKAIIMDNKIVLPLTMIKGIGNESVKLIINERQLNGVYKNFFDFLLRMDNVKSIGLSTIQILIKANALKCFGYNQMTLLSELLNNNNNSDTMLMLKYLRNNDNQTEVNNAIKNWKPYVVYEQNIDEENENEIALLGQIYNLSLTEDFEVNGSRLIDMHIGNEYLTTLFCNSIMQKTSKNGSQYYLINLQDSTKKISIFYFGTIENYKKFNKQLVSVNIYVKSENQYILKGWKLKHE